jgi:hypothetical protein
MRVSKPYSRISNRTAGTTPCGRLHGGGIRYQENVFVILYSQPDPRIGRTSPGITQALNKEVLLGLDAPSTLAGTERTWRDV